jgi:hypothetical protein
MADENEELLNIEAFVLTEDSFVEDKTKETTEKIIDEGKPNEDKPAEEKPTEIVDETEAEGEGDKVEEESGTEEVAEDIQALIDKSEEDVDSLTDEEAKQLSEHLDSLENNTDGVDGSVLPLIEAIHEKSGWEFKEEDFKDKNSVEGLMEFVDEVIAANSNPEFASDEVASFNEFVSKYGIEKAGEYLETNYGQVDYETIDTEDVDNQKRVYKDYLKSSTKYSDAKIDKEIKKLIDLDELGEEIEDAKAYLIEDNKTKKVEFERNQELAKQAQIDNFNNYLDTQKNRIDNAKKIAGFEPTKKEREDFYKFAYVKDRTGKTGYQKHKEANESLDLDLLWHAFKGTNKESISKGVKTETAKKLKESLSRRKDNKGGGTGVVAPKKSNPKKDVDYNQFLI